MVKLNFTNAFNSLSRTNILAAVSEHITELLLLLSLPIYHPVSSMVISFFSHNLVYNKVILLDHFYSASLYSLFCQASSPFSALAISMICFWVGLHHMWL